MATKKKEAPKGRELRRTWKVKRAFQQAGIYYTGLDVPEIGANLSEAEIKDREDRGYIESYMAHTAAPATTTTTPAPEA
jgi:hypothetical protein